MLSNRGYDVEHKCLVTALFKSLIANPIDYKSINRILMWRVCHPNVIDRFQSLIDSLLILGL
ncbi:hypothetical protein [Shewanella psychrotolerans]|uniref:hypothetical protein n=1 Tax=Shewanella psychrotolerans TaxID=2864206 RepID=UPI001C65827B|nr:hypothetical protein [Shewanella psychrotolerans]QYK01854.1 hypothetical protein K0I62_02410 [Shewanella psychrotolerans]